MNALKRPRQHMADLVQEALDRRKLWDAYRARPDYQQNDYLLWINSAKRDDTKQRRLDKMLGELDAGNGYMGMRWAPKADDGGAGKKDG